MSHVHGTCIACAGKLGFRRQKVLQVKSADAAAAGAQLDDAAIKARQALAGSFVEAEKRVYETLPASPCISLHLLVSPYVHASSRPRSASTKP